jgi:hypothetical protein
VHFGSRGRISPTAAEIRKRIGHDNWTTPSDIEKAVESYDAELKRRGMKPLQYKLAGVLTSSGLYASGASRQSLIARIKRLEMVHIAIDYGRVNDTMPALSGSPTFREGHSIWVGGGTPKRPGWRERKGKLEVRYSDSTWGRAGAPKATPKWVPFAWVWSIADGAWSSRGGRGWVGGSVACSPLLPKPPKPPKPEPDPEDPCEDIVADLEARLDAAEEELAEVQALVDDLRARIPDEELLERLREVRDDIDALIPVIDDDTPIEPGMEVPE